MDRLITPVQLEELSQVPLATLAYWRHVGSRGPAYVRLENGKIRYRESDVQAWLKLRTVEAAHEGDPHE